MHGRNRPVIYWIGLLIIIIGLVSVLLVKVDVSVGGIGQIRPEIERLRIYNSTSGTIKEVLVKENEQLEEGTLILTLNDESLHAQSERIEAQKNENNIQLNDLIYILEKLNSTYLAFENETGRYESNESSSVFSSLIPNLNSPLYIREYTLFLGKLENLRIERNKVLSLYNRYQPMKESSFVSDSEMEKMLFAVQTAERQIDLEILTTVSRWQAAKIERELAAPDLESQAKQIDEFIEKCRVKTPAPGKIINFVGIHKGMYLPEGQILGEISPNSKLQAETYISPKDIGFIEIGQEVQIHVDAFPYTEWGAIVGSVREISPDVVQQGQQIAFKATIDLDATSLSSSSGATVDIKRGMTINARFLLKKQRLIKLLHGKLSDSLDPAGK